MLWNRGIACPGQVIPGVLPLPAGVEGAARSPPHPKPPWFRRGSSSFSVTLRLTFRTSPPAGGTGWPSALSSTGTGEEGALEKAWLEGCCPGAALSSQGLGRSGGLLQELAIGQLQSEGGFSWTLAQAKGRSGAMRRNALSVPPWIDTVPQEAFCFLPRPDIIDFKKLTKSNAVYNLQQAFNTAEQQLGLAKLLDPEGKALNWP